MSPLYKLQVKLSYDFGGESGPGMMFDEMVAWVDYEQLLKDIDRLGDELRAATLEGG